VTVARSPAGAVPDLIQELRRSGLIGGQWLCCDKELRKCSTEALVPSVGGVTESAAVMAHAAKLTRHAAADTTVKDWPKTASGYTRCQIDGQGRA